MHFLSPKDPTDAEKRFSQKQKKIETVAVYVVRNTGHIKTPLSVFSSKKQNFT